MHPAVARAYELLANEPVFQERAARDEDALLKWAQLRAQSEPQPKPRGSVPMYEQPDWAPWHEWLDAGVQQKWDDEFGPAVGEALGEVRQQLRDFVAAELGMLRVEVELTQSALRELRETHDELKKQVELIRAIRRGDIFELPINNADDDAA